MTCVLAPGVGTTWAITAAGTPSHIAANAIGRGADRSIDENGRALDAQRLPMARGA
jgi:hypothetical protein